MLIYVHQSSYIVDSTLSHCFFSLSLPPPLQLPGYSSEVLSVTQYHFTSWPDHGVPEYATPILTFHRYRRVKQEHKPSQGPMLVHMTFTPNVFAMYDDSIVVCNFAISGNEACSDEFLWVYGGGI